MAQEETRKGPWTEQEDLQLVYFVSLFGERRWDFIAKVSGLNRTGKSCRLRWVNYLHPGLKRGRMTPQEEKLVLEFHSKWGNRWSRIARKLPGRTDNEIKNYWRTHMRKKAQERKRALSLSGKNPLPKETKMEEEGSSSSNEDIKKDLKGKVNVNEEEAERGYPMDRIWDEIASSEEASSCGIDEGSSNSFSFTYPAMESPLWDADYSFESLWNMNEEEEFKSLYPFTDFSAYNYGHSREI
ncbi:hypothetical protein ACHQM5_021518 [Ranunculus cassubicifolius]